jgi:L-ascorbate metabolism protein UlaG (beta-lactamase superfamily)
MKPMAAVLPMLLSLLYSAPGCANPYFDPAKPHHTPTGFRNNYPHDPPGSFLKWQWERLWAGLPNDPPPGYRTPVAAPDAAWLRANRAETTFTWIGHVTFLYQSNGVNVLTDPQFSERASPVRFIGPRRKVPPAIALKDLPRIDLVVISHNHYDHLDRASVVALNAQPGGPPLFLVPLGLKPWLADEGISNAVELDWWQEQRVGALTAHLLPVQHWSARSRTDRDETLWGGWLLDGPGFRFFFAGDTGYSDDFKDIARRFPGIDLAAIPIGSYEPRWFMKWAHVNPEEAVRIHKDLGAARSVGTHWGTFQLTDESLDEPPRALAAALRQADVSPERFFVMAIGETRRYAAAARREPASAGASAAGRR